MNTIGNYPVNFLSRFWSSTDQRGFSYAVIIMTNLRMYFLLRFTYKGKHLHDILSLMSRLGALAH